MKKFNNFIAGGLENGIDFMQLDWGAGAFRDPDASVARIGLALVWKHASARGSVSVTRPLPSCCVTSSSIRKNAQHSQTAARSGRSLPTLGCRSHAQEPPLG